MARIASEVVERLKREVSLEQLARASGISLKRHGENLIGLCPFHDDRSPSFVVTPEKNLWHCLGACQAGGSVIDFVMKKERCSYRAALELLLATLAVVTGPRLALHQARVPVRQAEAVAVRLRRVSRASALG